jgi:hypothetical protein
MTSPWASASVSIQGFDRQELAKTTRLVKKIGGQSWVQGDNPKGEPALGTPDISSLADLGNVYET